MRCALLGFEIQTIFHISDGAFVAFTIQKLPGKRPCLDVHVTNLDAISLLLSRRIMRFSSMMMVPSAETIMTHSAAFALLCHGSFKKLHVSVWLATTCAELAPSPFAPIRQFSLVRK